MKISKHFSRSEFSCPCGCGFDTADVELVNIVLEDIRNYYDCPVIITSGARCEKYNAMINGAKHSRHLWAQASDIKVKGIRADAVADYLEKKYHNKYGIGRYIGRTHIDIRRYRARWDRR